MDFVGFPLQPIGSAFNETCEGMHGQGAGEGRITLILDAKACIQYCSAPTMFSSDEHNIQGQPITTVIPSLPFRPRTPGYNVAYTRFAFDDIRWHRHSVKLGDNRSAPMDLMVRAIPVNHGYCLLVLLKPIKVAPSDHISARKPQLRYVPSSELIRARYREKSDSDICVEPVRHEEPTSLRVASGW